MSSTASIPLYLCGVLSPKEGDQLLSDIRSTGYLSEISSGEPPEESGLWNLLRIVPSDEHDAGDLKPNSEPEKVAHHALEKLSKDKKKWNTAVLVLADQRTRKDGSLVVLDLEQGKSGKEAIRDSMRCARRSLLEVVSFVVVPSNFFC